MLPGLNLVIDATVDGLVDGLNAAERRVEGFRGSTDAAARQLQRFGDATTQIGRRMSVLSAGVIAVGGGMVALATQTTRNANEIRRFAQVSGTTTDEFQRMAAAARTVGMDGQGLADVFQDMNDRVGDFIATGGGPMADFFENIAPQVGVTADQFARLSGPDALQLYVSSLEAAGVPQNQMAFYMEAISSNTTRMIPLLADGGAEMRRLGDAAEDTGQIMSGDVISASRELSANMSQLTGNISGAGQQVTAALIPVFNNLVGSINEHVVPAIQSIGSSIASAIEWFGSLPVPVQEAAGIVAAAIGVGGPVLLAIGAMSSALGALVAATGPVGLLIAAAALAWTAWQTWGDDIMALVGTVTEWFETKFNELIAFFTGLPARFAQFGRDIVNGLMEGITERWDALMERFMGLAEMLPEGVREFFGIQSPSRLMHEIGTYIGQGFANGISDSAGLAQQAMGVAASGVEMTASQAAQSVVGSLGQMFQGSKPIAAAQALINTFLGMTEALKLPFPASLAASAQVLASGMSAVQSIRSASPSGGGGGGSVSSGGGAQGGGAQAMPMQNVMLDFGGTANNNQMASMDTFVDMANEAARQGLLLNFMVRR